MRDRIQNYVFTPVNASYGNAGTIEVQGYVETADILVITNVTTNTIIYQFSDANKGASVVYTAGVTANYPQSQNGVTTIILDYNTTLMSSTDKIQVYVETREVSFRPWHFGTDAIERMRMAQPQSLIDADFEYGLQNTKWQSLALNNNMPAIYEQPGADMTLNTQGYVTLIDGVAGGNLQGSAATTANIANQGTTYAPNWVQNDYALLISANVLATTTANITANVTGPNQRSISFLGNTAAFAAGDLIAIYKVEEGASTVSVSGSMVNTANITLNITGANNIVNGSFLQVATTTANTYELMSVNSGGGSGQLTVSRQRCGTNPASALVNGGSISVLANIEVAYVYSIDSNVSMTINRGWYNTVALDKIQTGSQIQRLNTGASSTGNLEIVKLTTVGTTAANTITISRGQVGTSATSTWFNPGSLIVRLVGIFTGGTANVAQIGVNTTSHNVIAGAFISTQNHIDPNSEGLYYLAAADTNNFFYYPKKSNGFAIGYPLNRYDTVLRKATAYTGADLPVTSFSSDGANPSTITVTTPYAHGLSPGTPLLIQLTAGTNASDYGSGAFPITSVPTLTTFTYVAKSGAAVSGLSTGTVYLKPNAYYVHRPFDGGIALTNGSPHHGALAARQTKKYFRYQSGKGMFFTSGTLFCPTFDVTTMSADGLVANSGIITISTEQSHQLQVGARVRLAGVVTTGYNNLYTVRTITDDRTFTVRAVANLGALIPNYGTQPRINVLGWYGGAVRCGMFDDQNGLFWEYDGESTNVARRSGTFQVTGLASVQVGSNLVTGDGTCRFQDQLTVGSSIIIRGMTHTVTTVTDQNTMTVVPEYRGANNEVRVKLTLVQELRVPQRQFNVDVLDGTGPSGYVLDPAKMQMILIQYTWYGAGFVEFGLRGPNGKFILAHRIRNNNVNDEAYMRSGNLPCRYETSSTGAQTKLFANITNSDTTILINDGTFFPANVSVSYPVYISIENEIISYGNIIKGNTSNTVATLSSVVRNATLNQWIEGANRSFTQGGAASHTAGAGTYVLGCTTAPTLTHWGSAVILDGRFDDDKGYSFTFNRQNVTLPILEGAKTTLFLMRLSPAVSNTIIGSLGTRDLVNRAALNLNQLTVNLTGGRYLVEGILNPQNINLPATTFVNLNTTATGSQPSFTQFATSINFTGTTQGGITSGAVTASGTGTARGGVRANSFSYAGQFVTANTTYWANNVPVGQYVTGGGNSVYLNAQVKTQANVFLANGNVTLGTIKNFQISAPGGNVQVGDTFRVYGNTWSPAMTFGTNDANLTVTAIGTDAQFANLVQPTTVTGAGTGANITLRLAADNTQSITNYASRSVSYTVNATGDGYQTGDQIKIYGNALTGLGSLTTNDVTLTLTSVAGSVTGGERLFAIPVNVTNSGVLDLSNVKELGTSAVPGNGVYPDGPEVLAITITCLTTQATQTYADVQISFSESQA